MREEAEALGRKREYMRVRTRNEGEAILAGSGLAWKERWELANGYWPDSPDYDDMREPWWLFATKYGPIRIGRRKRVIEIEWTSTLVSVVVTDDDVTKSETHVHAWSVEKAIEYMTRWLGFAEAKP